MRRFAERRMWACHLFSLWPGASARPSGGCRGPAPRGHGRRPGAHQRAANVSAWAPIETTSLRHSLGKPLSSPDFPRGRLEGRRIGLTSIAWSPTSGGLSTTHSGHAPGEKRSRGAVGDPCLLEENVGKDVPGDSIAAVAGIGEWARRVRELRTEHGYGIPEIADGVYGLESVNPQEGVAARWRVANGIRRRSGSGRERILAFLMECAGEVVTIDQILYVARIKTAARRVRELRDEAGWPISLHIDEEGLRPGQYRLLLTDPKDRRDPLQRLYTEELWAAVFQRDDYRCQTCSRNRDEALGAGTQGSSSRSITRSRSQPISNA